MTAATTHYVVTVNVKGMSPKPDPRKFNSMQRAKDHATYMAKQPVVAAAFVTKVVESHVCVIRQP